MQSTLRPILSLLLGLFFLIVGHGMQMTLIPLRAQAEGWGEFEIGAIGSAFYVGYVVGCIGTPFLIRRAGHIRAFTTLVSIIASAMVLHPVFVSFPAWAGLRALLGLSLAGLYMILETWLNDRASNANRGLLMAAYIMVNYAALAVGQLMVTLASPESFTLFAVGTVAMSISAIPLALTRQEQPRPLALVRFRPMALYRLSPVGLIGACAAGVANGAFWSLGAVAAVGIGMSVRDAAYFMALVTAAGAFAQWPVGRVSDRVDRRLVLITILCAAAVTGLLLAFLPIAGPGWFVLAVFFGMAIAPSYSVAAAHAYDHAAHDDMVETATGLFLASAVGSIVGPLVASAMMERFGPPRLFLFTAMVQLALSVYVITRVRARQPIAQALKTDFDLAGSTPIGAGMPPVVVEAADAATGPQPPPVPPPANAAG